jgi:hypothetical protein
MNQQPKPQPKKPGEDEENTRRAGGLIGGAVLGASLGGPVGAIVGGVVGLVLAQVVNDDKKKSGK